MTKPAAASLTVHFADLEDPRQAINQKHPLMNLIVIAVCAVICGADSFTEMEEFGKQRKSWLARFLDLSNGIPSHDTFNHFFARLKPQAFERCLLSWLQSLHELREGQIMAIDGKTLRGSYDREDNRAAIQMVSVWATANRLSLASRVVDEKSNEITAIPELLELIEVAGGIVGIDAMGCQKAIAKKIRDRRADYVLAVKQNQPKLHKAVESFFETHWENDDLVDCASRGFETHEQGHGRTDDRYYYLTKVPEDFPLASEWPGLKAIGMAIRVTEKDGATAEDVRYYIASGYLSGRRFAQAVRGHWGIENSLHWQLDVTFGEDALRIRKGHAPANMSILMRTALGLLKNETTNRRGLKTKRFAAAMNPAYLEKVLRQT